VTVGCRRTLGFLVSTDSRQTAAMLVLGPALWLLAAWDTAWMDHADREAQTPTDVP
jgi:hypothetical protein